MISREHIAQPDLHVFLALYCAGGDFCMPYDVQNWMGPCLHLAVRCQLNWREVGTWARFHVACHGVKALGIRAC